MTAGYARRAKFATSMDISKADEELMKDNEFVKKAIETDNPMVDIPIESVFAFSRIKRPIGLWHFCFFLLWTPIGIPVLLFRSCIMFGFLGFYFFISKTRFKGLRVFVPYTFIHIIMPICGLLHTVRGQKNKDAVLVDKCVFVSNHISNFDPLWFNCIFQDFTLLCAGDYDYFWEAMKAIGVLNLDDEDGRGCIYTNYFGTAEERDEVKFAIEEDMARDDARPFLIYPEGCVTTGVCAVMQYQRFVFGLDKIVVPMCLSLFNPWPYEHYTLSSGAAQHLLWYMFSPFVIMNHAILPPQKLEVGESHGNFALRVQCMTAAHLGLGVIKMNWKQKDRLGQALGFAPYSENIWSRRESMDEFRAALFARRLVLRDGVTVTKSQIEKERTLKESKKGIDGAKATLSSLVTPKKPLTDISDEGAYLAKDYAARHNKGRNTEMKIFDDAMARAGSSRRASGIVKGLVKKGTGIDDTVNNQYVKQINSVRRANVGTDARSEMQPHKADAEVRIRSVREKRRASVEGAVKSENVNRSSALDALIAKHGGVKREEPNGNKVAPLPQGDPTIPFGSLLAKHGGVNSPPVSSGKDIPHPFAEDLDEGKWSDINVPAGDGAEGTEAADKGGNIATEKV